MKLKRTSLVEEVINAFIRDVEDGLYGEKLPSQKELANHYQVSLIVIREALSKLSAIGMIRFQQGKGTYLNKPGERPFVTSEFSSLIFHDVKNLRAIVEARQIIERETSSLAAIRKTDKDILNMEEAINMMKKNLNDNDTFAFWDLKFHNAVAQASNNPVLHKLTMLLIDSYRTEVSKFFQLPGVIEKVYTEHEGIYKNILEGNSDEASLIMYSHLEMPEKVFLAKMAESENQ